ncbi:universal stress protein [Maribellus sediminis]|uniref:universal stress protein n=1 Tax=Maribellus sediminis TaxID=2696285 RepID=UPI00142FD09C|nr:universal stress protein [Maribellus sediminis]
MEEKLITLVVLPYSKAHIFKVLLEEKGIDCELEYVNLIQGDTTATVRFKILEKDIQKAVHELELFLGTKTETEPESKADLPKQILVPIDFSEASLKAAKTAVDIAAHVKSEVLFMHSFINPIIHSIPYSDIYAFDSSALFKIEHAEENANKDFKKFIKKLNKEVGEEVWNSIQTDYIIKSGYAEEDILAYARKNHPRLIVVGSGGDNYPQGIVGSVTADIMYNANVPVLVIPKDTPDKKVTEINNVMYATNFDEKDFVAIDKLLNLLEPFDIKLTCAHVGEPRRNSWDLARLEGMKELLQKKYEKKNFTCMLLEGNEVLETIESYIKNAGIDMLSLTTHKRNMIARLFNPSFARKMVFHSNTPLLVFHA